MTRSPGNVFFSSRSERFAYVAAGAFGATTVLFMSLLWPLDSYLRRAIFHLEGSVGAVVGPVLIEFGIVWLVLTVAILATAHHVLMRRIVWVALLFAMLRQVVEYWYSTRPEWPPVPTWLDVVFLLAFLLALAGVFSLGQRAPRWVMGSSRLGKTLLLFLALNGVIVFARIGSCWWQARNINAPRALRHETSTVVPPRTRIIWLVFDELSYKQVYGHRFAGLELPAFDQLAADSTIFTNVQPEGVNTEEVLPALMTGVPVTAVRWPVQGVPLYLKNANTGNWQEFAAQNTVFQDAVNDGYRTGIAGWYVPYCRILPDVLDRCYWTNNAPIIPYENLFSGHSLSWNTKTLLKATLETRASQLKLMKRPVLENLQTDAHREVYQHLVAHADTMLGDPSLDFLLIHLPIPHPKGIFDRRTMSFSYNSRGYIDSLALCDLYLAHLVDTLKKNGTWDNTTLVIMGDHSWRVDIFWKRDYLTAEEDAASGGERYDPRPGYIVHMAGQKTPERVDAPYKAIRTRAMFDAMMRGEIVTPEQLQQWAQQPGK